jgi:dihydroorotate dehydrogenase (fumarate)
VGGVFTPEQAYRKIRKGSSLVMFVSSLMYRGPQNITTLKRGLADLLRRDGFDSIDDAVGIDVD